MPIQMVCDSTSSLVSAAIRGVLHSTGTSNGRLSVVSGMSQSSVSGSTNGISNNTSNSNGGISGNGLSTQNNKQLFRRVMCDNDNVNKDDAENGTNDLVESISQSLRHGQQVKPITYEEGPSYSTSLDELKSKYIVLRATSSDVSSESENNSNPTVNGSGNGSGEPLIHVSKTASNTPISGGPSALASMNGSMKFSATHQPMNGGKMTSSTNLQNGVSSATAPPTGKETATLPTPKKTLFRRENVQIGWKTTGRKWHVGAGMINMGNTCYLNSTLQALFHVPAIANWLLSDVQHRERCDDGGSGGSCIICAMAKTLAESQSNQSAIRPYLVYSKLRLVCKHLVPGRQEDAHEFLRYLMEAMEKSYLGRYKNSKELDQYSKETTPLNQILGGYLRSEVKCLSCQHVSTTFQHFEDLLLDIRKANSIDEALEVYFARERLEEMGYKCEACRRRVAATKQFSLERAPFALCVQLKRFSMLGGKINKHVELRSRLDLTPYSSPALKGSNGKLIYRLTSMVTHLGSTQHCGHYTAIGHTDTGGYHVFDDSSVRPIGMHNVTSTNAYILFYELESAAGSAGLSNGICRTKPSATVCQPSSTATLTSMGHLSNDTGGTSVSSGTLGKAPNSSPLRVLGTGGGNGTAGGFFPSKLEQKSGFIGPVLPTTTASTTKSSNSGPTTSTTTISNSSITAGNRAGSFVSSVHTPDMNGSKDIEAFSSPSSTLSTLSNSSFLSSPLKQQPSQSPSPLTSPVRAAGPFHQKTPKLSGSISNGTVSTNGSVINGVQPFNGLNEDKKSLPLLPSMPKLLLPTASSDSKTPAANKSSKPTHSSIMCSSVVSLVPYETDDDSDDSVENEHAHKKAAAASANGCKRTKPNVTNVCNGGKPAKMNRKFEQCGKDGEDRARNGEEIERHSTVGDDRQEEMVASRSPQMIKTKTGLWKVSKSSTLDQLSCPDSGSSNGGTPSSSKASSPATSGGSSPASSPVQQRLQALDEQTHPPRPQLSQQQQPHPRNGATGDGVNTIPLTNGYRHNNAQGHQQQSNGGGGDKRKPIMNGYHTAGGQSNGGTGKSLPSSCSMEKTGSGGGGAVQMLLKLSHRGYGAPVKSWDGQETDMDRELANERREERKRQIDDDRETEMDRGRTKKSKAGGGGGSSGGSSSSANMFQLYQDHHNGGGGGSAKWAGNGNRHGNHYSNHHQNNSRSSYYNGNGLRHHGGGGGGGGGSSGFRNGGRRYGGRNGGGFHSKTYHHHQRSESSGGGGVASSGNNNSGSNGFYNR